MIPLLGGIYIGWGVGANDASNVFGTAVGAGIIRYRNAAVLCASAIILGAILQGEKGIETLSSLTEQNDKTLLIVSMSAAFTVTVMTILGLPISTSQAMVGAIAGTGLAMNCMRWEGLVKCIVCWIATPLGAMIFSVLLYLVFREIFRRVPMSILTRDKLLWCGLAVVGIYGSYALGANNVANATGIFAGRIEGIDNNRLALLGGVAIAAGVLTGSRIVMKTVGKSIMKMDAFTAMVAVSSMSLTVHLFAMVGVPVSTSQGIIGAIVGLGFIRGASSIHFKALRTIACGWILTPAISLVLSAAGYAIFVD